MNNIYQNKYEKYKLKYLKLKTEYIGGGRYIYTSKKRNKLNLRLEEQTNEAKNLLQECTIIKNYYNKILQQKEEVHIEKEEAYKLVGMLNRQIINIKIIIKLIKAKEAFEFVQLKNETVSNLLKETKKQEALTETKEVMLIEELAVLKKEIDKASKAQKEFSGSGINKAEILKEILINEREKVLLQCLEVEAEAEADAEAKRESEQLLKQPQTLEHVHKQAVLIKILTRRQVILQEQEILFQQEYKKLLETYFSNNTEIEKILQISLDQYKEENNINKGNLVLAQEQYLIKQNKYMELEKELVLKKEEYRNKYSLYKEALRLQNLTENNIKKLPFYK
jgi:hypothetical protein